MSVHMCFEALLIRRAVVTQLTSERFFLGVFSHVRHQILLSRRAVLALRTLMRALSIMFRGHVVNQAVLVDAGELALVAFELFLRRVLLHMRLQIVLVR